MARRLTLEEKLAQLHELAQRPLISEVRAALVQALADTSNILIARSAQALGRSGCEECLVPLRDAFRRIIALPSDADKGCRAKEAIVQALEALDNRDETVYLRGIRHRQMEPVYGGRADTAPILRGLCAVALARIRYPEVYIELVTLLADSEQPARLAAVNTLTYLGDERSELLLRMKVLAGDADAEVVGRCFTGLLVIEPERSVPFITRFLPSADPALAEQAAYALGESRLEIAFAALRAYWDSNVDLTFNKTLLLAIALTRCDAAFDFLLDIIRTEGRGTALKAIEALAIYAADERRRERIRDAVEAGGDARVKEAFQEHCANA